MQSEWAPEEGFGPRSWQDEDDKKAGAKDTASPAAPPASPAAPKGTRGDPDRGHEPGTPLERALLQLRETVEGSGGLDEAQRHDLLLDVEALGLETQRHELRHERLLARLDEIAAHAGLGEACEAVRGLVSD